jgi:S-adenosylmethionine-dependent methyltransferase
MALRYNLELANIHRHVLESRLRILDAGGGNGHSAITFAKLGHDVSLVDLSTAMLVDGLRAAEQAGVSDRIVFYQADVTEIPALFPKPVFDLVLCHHVLPYVDDAPAALQAVCHPLRAGGWISLATVNAHSEVYKAAFRELDLEKAYARLDSNRGSGAIFGVPIQLFTYTELSELVEAAGCVPVGRYGVRCLCDWLPNEPKFDPEFMQRLERLELALADRHPYYLTARFIQILARKTSCDA